MFKKLISKYLEIINSEPKNSELYKWEAISHFQTKWNINCSDEDFYKMFKDSFSKRSNLIFQNSFGFLGALANEMPEQARALFSYLYQDEIPLQTRIVKYQEMANDYLPELKKKLGKDNINHQQDERTIAFLLTLHNPEKYFLYKDNIYKALCNYLNVPIRKAGEKYLHFIEIGEQYKQEIFNDEEILHNQIIQELIAKFNFNSTNLLFQDVVYRTLLNNNEEEKQDLDQEDTMNTSTNEPLNQILYGPPGTGKTYHTISKALQIVEPKFYEENKTKRDVLVQKFNSLLYDEKTNPEGAILFSTFHQSFSYEDFIEGIKPVMNGSGELEYEIKDGVFKQLVNLAKRKESSNFSEAYSQLLESINNSENEYLVLKTARGKEFRVNVNSNNNLNLFTSQEIKKQGVLSKVKLSRYFEGENNVFDGWEGYASGVIEYLTNNFQLSKTTKSNQSKKYVIIIDEINRGNVSAIFGELITLIEDDKRMGKPNELSVTLPYSRDKFSIPSNLFIIGTMNTADRSVEALDTALRRRFSFSEMLPQTNLLSPSSIVSRFFWKYEALDWENKNYLPQENILRSFLGQNDDKVWETRIKIWDTKMKGKDETILNHFEHFTFEGINLMTVLDTINKRIEILVDRDHTIGHAYFMNIFDEEGLINAFKNKIIPLLQEYFYGNYEKMAMVIGMGFFEEKKTENVGFAIPNDNYEEAGKRYSLKTINASFDIKTAIDKLLAKKKANVSEFE